MSDLLSIDEAVSKYQIPERTLLALIERNGLKDPLGWDGKVADDWRLSKLAAKVAAGRSASNSPSP